MLEWVGQMFLTEGKLADGPDLGVRLQRLLQLRVKTSRLECNDLWGRIWFVRDWASFGRSRSQYGSPGTSTDEYKGMVEAY